MATAQSIALRRDFLSLTSSVASFLFIDDHSFDDHSFDPSFDNRSHILATSCNLLLQDFLRSTKMMSKGPLAVFD